MGTIYFFDKHVKKHLMKGTKAVNPSNSGVFPNGVSCIRAVSYTHLTLPTKLEV